MAKLTTALTLQELEVKIPICQTWVIPPNFDEDEIEEYKLRCKESLKKKKKKKRREHGHAIKKIKKKKKINK